MKKSILLIATLLITNFVSAQNGLKVGDKAPDFIAKDQNGDRVHLYEALKTGKVLVVFYRGHWCPNCMRSLKNIQDSINQLESRKLTIIAVSPESNEGVAKTSKISKATFPIISDQGLDILNDFKVAFEVTPEMDAIHRKYSIDVKQNNGKNGNILPRPAAFVIDENGIIIYRYFNTDPYSNPKSNERVTVRNILENLK